MGRLNHLRYGVGYESVVGMAVASVRSPSHDNLRMQLRDQLFCVVGHGLDVLSKRVRHSTQLSVIQLEKDGRLQAKLLAGTLSFRTSGLRQRLSGRNRGMFIRSFLSFGGDGQVNLDAFARIAGKYGTGERLVIRMSEHRQEYTLLLWDRHARAE